LHARVVKFTGLPDDDGASANDENAFDVGTFWHGGLLAFGLFTF
jgi:hypothetical protein